MKKKLGVKEDKANEEQNIIKALKVAAGMDV